MAEPITNIKRKVLSEEEEDLKYARFKKRLTDNDESIEQVLDIIEELHKIGALEAVTAMLLAKEDITKIALDEVSKEPVTNLLNTLIGSAGSVMATDPDKIKDVISGTMAGLEEGHDFAQTETKIKLFDVMKMLNDPDINRAVGFGIHFLKGMGKHLNETDEKASDT